MIETNVAPLVNLDEFPEEVSEHGTRVLHLHQSMGLVDSTMNQGEIHHLEKSCGGDNITD